MYLGYILRRYQLNYDDDPGRKNHGLDKTEIVFS